MKKKILVRGPVLSQSGYGEQSRFALRALKSQEDKFDIFILPVPWGKTGWIWEESEFREWMDTRITLTQVLIQKKQLQVDMSLQITIPNEFQKMAPINIGYTAGIETHKCSNKWLPKCNEMDKVLVVSNHAKHSLVNTVAKAQNPQTGDVIDYRIDTPVEVVWENTPRHEPEDIPSLKLKHDFNFLAVSQISPRKNFENMVRWFVEEFIDQEVGFVIKTNVANNSTLDWEYLQAKMKEVLKDYKDRKCSVYLLHGDLTPGQMTGLYRHEKIKGMINIAHGEGFGLPLFEAAREGLPITTIGWSGQLDFLHHDGKDYFNKVDYTLQPIQKQAVWQGVLEKDAMWAYADQGSYKMALRKAYKNYDKMKATAETAQDIVDSKFRDEVLYQLFCDNILGKTTLKPQPVAGISFCIATNGAKPEKTNIEIQSIKKTMSKVELPYEIIIAGDTDNFKDSDCVLVHTPEDAHGGLLAKLRNNAGEKVKYDAIVFVDDDFVFPVEWASRFIEYSKHNGWNVTANKILTPDGGRFWDRATLNPHKLVSYDHPEYDKNLYQTGGFWIMRKDTYKKHKWDSSIPIYADKQGRLNEDVEMSLRMHKNGVAISFDKENTVWHNDEAYIEYEDKTLKLDVVAKALGISADVLKQKQSKKLESLLRDLHE